MLERDDINIKLDAEEKDENSLNVNFIANAGVKDIVGRGLIYNDNVAIIELIKNSKDATSSKVILELRDIIKPRDMLGEITPEPTIVIKDYGVGMSKKGIKEKWLNIAYSEKKGNKNKQYAGNKGVGRFSCDRLGKVLELFTKSIDDDYLKLTIDWTEFENKGQHDEISSVPLRIDVLHEEDFLNEIDEASFKQGTVLVIKGLRSTWNEQKLKKLLSEIEKFSPVLDDSFSVYFKTNVDFKDSYLKRKSNKNINNNILDKLSFRTTYIKSKIGNDGKEIQTTLYFQGEVIYEYTAVNPYIALKGISIEIHYLDSLSKSYFTKNFGVKPNDYGSVFLFYNSFRISPYGNEKNDWLGLDQRKSQGTTRNLGTREVIGKIDIFDQDEAFSVITSREGLAHNQAYYELVAYDSDEKATLENGKEEYGYVTTIIRQLENFVVKGTDWNRLIDKLGENKSVSADDIIRDPDRFTVKKLSSDSVKKATDNIKNSHFEIIDSNINEDVISRVQSINDEKYRGFLNDFIEKTKDKTLEELSPKEKGVVKKILEVSQNRVVEANKRVEKAEVTVKKAEKDLKIEKKKQAYLLATRRTLSKDADGLIHTIKINNIEIKEGIDSIIDGLEYDEISKEDLIKRLGDINLYAVKSLKMAEIATRSGFDKEIDIRNVDIVQYVKEYLDIYSSSFGSHGLTVELIGGEIEFIRSVSVLSLSIILDNLLSNSSKWSARNVLVNFVVEDGALTVTISDDGTGLSELFQSNPDEIFSLGARDEPPEGVSGSGIGLHYSRGLLEEMNASIEFFGNGTYLSGACFKVLFR
ncbi:sensor histidine kinase [Motilimonas sp. KMU-193]|uniref:sensor histidine kinase n=1 Tax=Motilimonas sp. KMU-193 TaxID=3388668 RepID=UPI00396AFBA3